jgi:hypothetical protein
MQLLAENTAGLRLVVNLNIDRLIYSLTLVVALGIGAWVGAMVFPG